MVGTVAAMCWGGGFLVGAVGIWTHQLWLVYIGYGALGGCGLGLGYVSPVSTLIRWFPDRRGMAAGMAIMGFGGGAMIGAPLKKWLLGLFYVAPQKVDQGIEVVTRGARRVAEVAGELRDVVEVTENGVDIARVPADDLLGHGAGRTAPATVDVTGLAGAVDAFVGEDTYVVI